MTRQRLVAMWPGTHLQKNSEPINMDDIRIESAGQIA
jgi:hypothetical protein